MLSALKLVALFSVLSVAFAACPPNTFYNYNDQQCYYGYNASTSWFNARTFCQSMGGALVVPINAFDNALFTSVLQEFGSLGTWLGAYSGDNGVWYDYTGKPIVFTRWAPREPAMNSSCASMTPDGYWYADYCDRGDWFICRIDPNSGVPTVAPTAQPTLPPATTTTRIVNPPTTTYRPPVTPNPQIRCPGYNTSLSSTPCGYGWHFYLPTCSCYSMSTKTLSWFEAEQNCVNNKAHLASVHSQEEAVYIKGMTLDTDKYIHIGLQFIGMQWLWSDGTPVDFTNFAPRGVSTDLTKNSCAMIYTDGYYFASFMGTLPCNERHYHSVCKKPLL